jgi:hypothetical protein
MGHAFACERTIDAIACPNPHALLSQGIKRALLVSAPPIGLKQQNA